MEIPPSRWSTAGRQRGARPYPKNELREPALGCAAYPRRASEARLRRRPVDSLEVHGTEARSCRPRSRDLWTPVPQFGFPGLKPGDRWCLCAPRWQKAFEASQAPRVALRATHEAALAYCSLADLKRFAVDLA